MNPSSAVVGVPGAASAVGCIFRAGEPQPVCTDTRTPVQWLGSRVQAGFPSPAEDFAVKRLDLNEMLIKHPQASFFMRVRGDSMVEAGIADGDTILIDRAIKACHGHVVVAMVDGELTVKRLWKRGERVKLQAANPTFRDIVPRDGQEIEIWGVVTTSIKTMRI